MVSCLMPKGSNSKDEAISPIFLSLQHGFKLFDLFILILNVVIKFGVQIESIFKSK